LKSSNAHDVEKISFGKITTNYWWRDGQNTDSSRQELNVKHALLHAESKRTNQSAFGSKRGIHAANAKLHILPATLTTKNWRLLKTKVKYILPFAFHANAQTPQEHQWNALGAKKRRIETNLASPVSAAKVTQRGVVWNAIFHYAKYAKQNLTFLKWRLTYVNHAHFRHAYAVHHDLAAQNIGAATKI
jgi:hypothetical protein